jgi:hypothetical protein
MLRWSLNDFMMLRRSFQFALMATWYVQCAAQRTRKDMTCPSALNSPRMMGEDNVRWALSGFV